MFVPRTDQQLDQTDRALTISESPRGTMKEERVYLFVVYNKAKVRRTRAMFVNLKIRGVFVKSERRRWSVSYENPSTSEFIHWNSQRARQERSFWEFLE